VHLFPSSSSYSDGGIKWDTFSRLGRVTLLAGTFGVPEQASDQIQGNPSDPFPSETKAIILRHISSDSDD
jgi:hypothetical protein